MIIARAAFAPMAEACRKLLKPPLAEIIAATGRFLRATGEALAAARAANADGGVRRARRLDGAAMAELRRLQLTQALPGEEAGRIFALGFAFDQLRGDLHDLTSRAGGLAEGGGPEERGT